MIDKTSTIAARLVFLGLLGMVLACLSLPATAATPEHSVAAHEIVITHYTLPPDKLAKAQALYRTRVIMFVVGSAYGLGVLVLIIALRLGSRVRDRAERFTERCGWQRASFAQAAIVVPLLVLSIDVLSLPLGVYRHHLSLEYGLSVQPWGSWLGDWAKGAGVGIVIATPIVWGLYAIVRRSPTRWWLYGWLASVPVAVCLVFVQPLLIDPLFNKFEPLAAAQPSLVPELEKVMHRGGLSIERSRMFEMKASDKVTTYNAYVTGIGDSKRVVVWDNTARDMTVPEILFVFGHEQGHYVLDHIWWSLAFGLAGLLIAFYLAYKLIGVVLTRWGGRLQIRGLGDWASLPVLMLMVSVFELFGQPIDSAFSRYLEHQADTYGLEVIHGLVPDSSQVAADAFQKLGEKALAYPDPNPLYVFWAYSHPPIDERIRFALTYRPWDRGQPDRFVKSPL